MLLKSGTVALAAFFLLSACGQHKDSETTTTTTTTTTQSNQTAASDATAHDPCAVLTKADVQAVSHKKITDVEKADDTHCNFTSKSGSSPQMIIVEAAWTGADTQFQANAAAGALMGQSNKAPKVGDASYSGAMGQVFYARKGDAYVAIDMRGAAVPVETVGPELARRALARM